MEVNNKVTYDGAYIFNLSKFPLDDEGDCIKNLKDKLISNLFHYRDNVEKNFKNDSDSALMVARHQNLNKEKIFNQYNYDVKMENNNIYFDRQMPKLNIKNYKSNLQSTEKNIYIKTGPNKEFKNHLSNYNEYIEDDAVFLENFLSNLEKKKNKPRKKITPLPTNLSISNKLTKNSDNKYNSNQDDKHDLVFKKLNSENIKTLESSKRIILDDNSENLKIKKIISNITIKKAKKSINNVKMDLKNYNKMIQNDVRFIENKQNEIREIIKKNSPSNTNLREDFKKKINEYSQFIFYNKGRKYSIKDKTKLLNNGRNIIENKSDKKTRKLSQINEFTNTNYNQKFKNIEN